MDNNIKHSRFKDAEWFPKKDDFEVIIGGAGGIGSWTSLLISRTGFKVILYDFDIIEEHNMGGQLFTKFQVDKAKVDAVAENIKLFCDEDITVFTEKVTSETMSGPYVISAFDNMQARKDMFAGWKRFVESISNIDNSSVEEEIYPIFIDGRLTAEQLQIFCVTPDRIEEYEKYLFDDSEVEEAPCTFKQTSHSAAMIASHITGFFTNHITNYRNSGTVRTVPFFWEYFIPIDYFNNTPGND